MSLLKEYEKLKKELEKKGHKVILPRPNEVFNKGEATKTKAMREFNKNLEKSDAILVANYDKNNEVCYIGVNSIMGIGMAFNRNKKIFILNSIPEKCRDELEAVNCIVLDGDLNNIS
ncbi:MAG TPA: hypothetical protein ENG87_00760 [Candidatus Pacearchaeota archaeon]|nr:hypothetical protein [Candidatus Pacearchaeota archaeon]